MGGLPEELSRVAGKTEAPFDGYDGTDQVRPLGGETGGDLPTHRMPYDDEILARVLGRDQRLDVGNVISGRVGT